MVSGYCRAVHRSPRFVRISAPLVPLLVALPVAVAGPAAPAEAAATRTVVVLGDSVPSGAVCRCHPFPDTYARLVAARTHSSVRVANEARSGESSVSELRRVASPGVRRAIRSGGTVLVMVGANDYGPAFQRALHGSCSGAHCYDAARAQVRSNVTKVLRTVRAVHRSAHIVVLGYWNVVRDGAVGLRSYGAAGLQEARRATQDANLTLLAVARANRATYVSTRVALRGADGSVDVTPYLAADGDHPNARGHALIARALYALAPRG
jgi:lysophospholipase L1-like esterase